MNLQSRPHRNGKQTDAMRQALISASLKREDKRAALKIWTNFRWRVKTTAVTARDIEALIDEAVVSVQSTIHSDVLKAQLCVKFDEMRKRAKEMAARPDEFLGAEPED